MKVWSRKFFIQFSFLRRLRLGAGITNSAFVLVHQSTRLSTDGADRLTGFSNTAVEVVAVSAGSVQTGSWLRNSTGSISRNTGCSVTPRVACLDGSHGAGGTQLSGISPIFRLVPSWITRPVADAVAGSATGKEKLEPGEISSTGSLRSTGLA
jgi:hypothetical protein